MCYFHPALSIVRIEPARLIITHTKATMFVQLLFGSSSSRIRFGFHFYRLICPRTVGNTHVGRSL